MGDIVVVRLPFRTRNFHEKDRGVQRPGKRMYNKSLLFFFFALRVDITSSKCLYLCARLLCFCRELDCLACSGFKKENQ